MHFVPFAVLSSSGDQMLGECTVPGGRCFVLFFFKFYFYFILLYNTILVLPYIDMNPPRVYIFLKYDFCLVGFDFSELFFDIELYVGY